MRKSIKQKTYTVICVVLCLLALAACGRSKEAEADPLAIKSFAIGDCQGTIETIKENGQTRYVINISLPEDTDFKHCAANIELQPGAEISADSPCLVDYMGGRPILNLMRQSRTLIVKYKGRVQNYEFNIGIL